MPTITSLQQRLEECYRHEEVDYYMEPLVRISDGIPVGRIKDGDTLFFCCRRGDRQIQLTEALVDPDFGHFVVQPLPDLSVVTLVQFHDRFAHLPTIFPILKPSETLGEVLSKAGVVQTRIAETEKSAHVTYFFNGRRVEAYGGEQWVIVPSPHSSEFLQKPATSTAEVAAAVEGAMDQQQGQGRHFILANLAAGDIIGHLDDWQANIDCAEAVDQSLSRICSAAAKYGYVVAVTADHGLLEKFRKDDGSVNLSHTTSRVPFGLVVPEGGPPVGLEEADDASLADVAPTLLTMMGIPVPGSMDGVNRASLQGTYDRIVLVVADGWGIGVSDPDSNPILAARTPCMDQIAGECPYITLAASGEAVGAHPGRSGNSETGHPTLGAGRVVLQDELRIARALETGELHHSQAVQQSLEAAVRRGSDIHVLTMLTKASSHGNMDEGLAVVQAAAAKGVKKVWLHLILDGRSSPPQGARDLLNTLRERLPAGIDAEVATVVGRGFALDRSGDYQGKTKRTYQALVEGKGRGF